jgi:2-methylcitrate dehydratase PrpD
MANIDRRTFLRATTAVAAGAVAPDLTLATDNTNKELMASPSPATPHVTKTLASYIVSTCYEDLPDNVRKQGLRTLLNWVGVAVGGSHHETIDIAVDALRPFAGPSQASILGRRERFDVMNAAFINGVSSHIFDYDDTHLKSIIHPAGPVMSAILALAEYRPVGGRAFLNALILGVETECRMGNAVYPDHYDRGWHITGTAGNWKSRSSMRSVAWKLR